MRISEGGPALRVLVIKLSAFGDIIHSLPIIECLEEFSRQKREQVELHWLIEKRWSPILKNHPGIHRLILTNTFDWRRALSRKSTWKEIFRCLAVLRENTYDIVIDINGLLRSALIARLTRAHLRVGFSRNSVICREKHSVWLLDKTHSVPHGHVVDQIVQLVEKTLRFHATRPLLPYLPVNDEAREGAKALLERNGLVERGFAIIAAGGGWKTKLLDERPMSALCESFGPYHLKPILSWYGDAERQRVEKISRLSRIEVKDLGDLPVDTLSEILRMARIVIGPDTGTVHAASAVKTPTVSYYGPSSAGYSGPRRSTDRVVQLSPPCGPCFRRRCGETLCHHLSIGKILDEIAEELQSRG